MPIAKIQLEDGRIAKFDVPEGTTQEQVMSFVSANRSQFDQAPDVDQPTEEQDIFSGLPQESVDRINQEFPIPSGERVRGGRRVGAERRRKAAADLERIRLVNPAIADMIEETGSLEAFLVGAGRGLTNIGRGVSRLTGIGDVEQEDDLTKQAVEGLGRQTSAVGAGEILGESAPFLLGGVAGAARSVGGRALGQAGVGAAEGATIAAGKGGSTGDILASAALGGSIGGAAQLAPASISGVQRGAELLKQTDNRSVDKILDQSAPSSDELKAASRKIFDEVNKAGVKFKPKRYRGLVRRIRKEAEDAGLDKVNTPQAFRAIERLESLEGSPSFNDLNQIRETARTAADNLQVKKEAALGSRIIDGIDDFFLKTDEKFLSGGANFGEELKVARELWGRASKSEMIKDALDSAELQASGFENGIRVNFRQILKNKRKRKFFKSSELEEIRKVVNGSKGANLFKLIGRLGPSEGAATNILGAAAGSGGGAAVGSIAGPAGAVTGAVVVPIIGQVSRKLAQKLTEKNARMADRVIRAGKDSNKIARAYLQNTSKKGRKPEELAQLLLRPGINVDDMRKTPFNSQVINIVKNLRQAPAAASAVAIPVAAEDNNE